MGLPANYKVRTRKWHQPPRNAQDLHAKLCKTYNVERTADSAMESRPARPPDLHLTKTSRLQYAACTWAASLEARGVPHGASVTGVSMDRRRSFSIQTVTQ